MKIKFIVPVFSEETLLPMQERVQQYVSSGTEVHLESIPYGTVSNESFYDEAVNTPGILKIAMKAQQDGYNGIFIECMLDLGIDAVREAVDIPVVGPGRTSLLYAADLAESFTIISSLGNTNMPFLRLVRSLGLEQKLASVRSIDIPVLDLSDRNKFFTAVLETTQKAIEEDGAHAIVLGCTRMIDVEADIRENLNEKGFNIPVVYGVPLTLRYLETLITNGLSQSKLTYMTPPKKEVNIWDRI